MTISNNEILNRDFKIIGAAISKVLQKFGNDKLIKTDNGYFQMLNDYQQVFYHVDGMGIITSIDIHYYVD
jgi:hypothetical protein